jgi:hypothetical protein
VWQWRGVWREQHTTDQEMCDLTNRLEISGVGLGMLFFAAMGQ